MSLSFLSLSIAQAINRAILGMLTKTPRFTAAGMFGDSTLVPSVPLQFQPNQSPAQLQGGEEELRVTGSLGRWRAGCQEQQWRQSHAKAFSFTVSQLLRWTKGNLFK